MDREQTLGAGDEGVRFEMLPADADLNAGFQGYLDAVYVPFRETAPQLLTTTQRDILQLIARGKKNFEIVQQLHFKTPDVLSNQLYGPGSAFSRLGIRSQEEAMLRMIELGQLDFGGAIQQEQLDLNLVRILPDIRRRVLFSLIKNGGKDRSNTVLAQEFSLSYDNLTQLVLPQTYRAIGVATRTQAVVYASAVSHAAAHLLSPQAGQPQ